MTKVETPATAEVVIVRDEAMALRIMGAEVLKKQIAEQAKLCAAMVIDDESSAQIAQQHLTGLSKVMKAVQKKGKELRTPFTNAAKLIKAVEDQMVGEAERVIAEGKGKIQVYHNSLVEAQETVVEGI